MSWWAFYEKEYGKPVGRNMGYDKARIMARHLFESPGVGVATSTQYRRRLHGDVTRAPHFRCAGSPELRLKDPFESCFALFCP